MRRRLARSIRADMTWTVSRGMAYGRGDEVSLLLLLFAVVHVHPPIFRS
jgi:hypothetical protein